MSENEPLTVMRNAAIDALGQAGRDLRRRGWPVALLVEHVPERDTYAVSLRVELPHMPTPVECAAEEDAA